VDLYIHFPIRFHGTVLNELSTGTTLPFLPFITHLNVFRNCICGFKSLSCEGVLLYFNNRYLRTVNLSAADHTGRAVFARSNTGIVGSDSTRGMDVCVFCSVCS
jgi:hypothetical protein